jgi:hypothetical protein
MTSTPTPTIWQRSLSISALPMPFTSATPPAEEKWHATSLATAPSGSRKRSSSALFRRSC